ncbi:BglII/BstYI family type II restriction endonuclease [Actinomycetospora straminea]|uniref:Restriction endonuclease BglII n=1 Tax=Actinomycetospora straminea TaxID=663607 RepID=A0ABP9E811_9PSEU|nr:BglII/BstYI family type II restriction endonuclease [Actinomycetospora straminea]MDD7932705.1 BglII/BstYI family type II restriction endonuclease [Actinomycetospora straminea]
MELTGSWTTALPAGVVERYELRETRNAAAVLAATSPDEFAEICAVLSDFALTTADLVEAGGNESRLAARLNAAFRSRGWREGRVDTVVTSRLQVQPWAPAGEVGVTVRESEVVNEGYKVDNVKGRVALDVEWNAKDGNLDRDISAYRALYDAGLIDGAVLLTRTHDDLRDLARELARAAGRSDDEVRSRLSTSTTTHLGKLESRMTRGDAGGCPLLAVAISRRCWVPADGEPARPEAPAPWMLTDGVSW